MTARCSRRLHLGLGRGRCISVYCFKFVAGCSLFAVGLTEYTAPWHTNAQTEEAFCSMLRIENQINVPLRMASTSASPKYESHDMSQNRAKLPSGPKTFTQTIILQQRPKQVHGNIANKHVLHPDCFRWASYSGIQRQSDSALKCVTNGDKWQMQQGHTCVKAC